jgi:hypothetical protein
MAGGDDDFGADLAVVVVVLGLRVVVVVDRFLAVVDVWRAVVGVAAARWTAATVTTEAAVVVVSAGSASGVSMAAVARRDERLARSGTSRAANSRDDGEASTRDAVSFRGRVSL